MKLRFWVAAVALCASVAGCAGTSGKNEPGQATPGPSSVPITTSSVPVTPEGQAWMERFCGVGRELIANASRTPDLGEQSAEEVRRWSVEFLNTGINELTVAMQRLGELGPSPVDGADRAVSDLTGRYTGLRESFTATRDKLQALRPGFTEAEVGRMIGESRSMPTLSMPATYPFEGIQITQAMRDAGNSKCGMALHQPKPK